MKLKEVKEKLYQLARELTRDGIPYNPPLKEEQMDRMKTHNQKGYKKLKEYLSLERLEQQLEEKEIGND